MQINFGDSIVNIAITGPLIRIDFGAVTPAKNAEGKEEVRLHPTQQVVMPLEGFVRAFGLQEQVIRKLSDDGVIKVQTKPPQSDVIKHAG